MESRFSKIINTVRVSHALHAMIVKVATVKKMSLSSTCAALMDLAIKHGLDKEII